MKPPIKLKIICDRPHEEDLNQPIPVDVMVQAKQIVRQYLPGMEGAQVLYSQEHNNCGKPGQPCQNHQGGNGPNRGKARTTSVSATTPRRRVLVLSKQVASSDHLHRHFARITLDEQNRLVKLVVSR